MKKHARESTCPKGPFPGGQAGCQGWEDNTSSQGSCRGLPVKTQSCKHTAEREKMNFPGSPVVKTLSSNAGGEDSTPGRGAKTPHAS